MSVLKNPVRAMKTLIAPTVKVLTVVLANRDLLAMEPFVKVGENILKTFPLQSYRNHPCILIIYYYLSPKFGW